MGARPKPVEVAADGVERKPFTSRFPFSFYLDRAIESMRESSNAIAASSGSGAHAALQSLSSVWFSLPSTVASFDSACCRCIASFASIFDSIRASMRTSASAISRATRAAVDSALLAGKDASIAAAASQSRSAWPRTAVLLVALKKVAILL